MPRAAVALATPESAARTRPTPDTELNQQLTTLRRQIGYGRRFRPGRSQLLLVGLIIVGVWLVLVFGRALNDLNLAQDRQSEIAAETQTLQARLDAGRRELQLVQTDAFQQLQARAFGLGANGEQVFVLASGAPSPDPIVPLGHSAQPAAAHTPLEAWLRLLFGN